MSHAARVCVFLAQIAACILKPIRLTGDRRREWVVAEAQGLVLEKVLYAEDAESAAIKPN